MFIWLIFSALVATCHCIRNFGDRATNFSMELTYFVAEECDWHTTLSPFGVWSLLTDVSVATSGKEKMELRRGLFLPKHDRFITRYHCFIENLTRPATVDITLRNKDFIFVDENLKVNQMYQKYTKKELNSEVIKLDFNSPIEAMDDANRIIEQTGIKLLTNVFRSEDFGEARMVLANVVSFNGLWQSPFKAHDTRKENFHDESGKVIGKVNMMHQKGNFKFSNLSKLSFMVLEMPYGEGGNYSFLVVLPYKGVEVSDTYKAFAGAGVKKILKKLEQDGKNVVVGLPRFHISSNLVLNKPLQDMQIVNILDPKSGSFTLISQDNLYVSAIIHVANIRVTETGIISPTPPSLGVRMEATSSFKTFNADRPFLYFIIYKSSATIIFSGVYSKPTVF